MPTLGSECLSAKLFASSGPYSPPLLLKQRGVGWMDRPWLQEKAATLRLPVHWATEWENGAEVAAGAETQGAPWRRDVIVLTGIFLGHRPILLPSCRPELQELAFHHAA